ncbi:Starch-binding associating with outer membrane [Pedobacter steynii]|uniref:Starch-binding associating with outer membrane n=1 Tax=Pedobacter steynii TaxID=430522 RepID=A0A1H0CL48_9SPHI|nr:RagB/SusD family nutrient uptake outer membrane protein [Pedobacter steynii]NQX41598.1 RagB/SusD family nutrient uptake outer membrane protein [Pedobacter steynii]SDN58552.1 Starch-binding associating with outer membrane [Pedobacter steynii]
MKKTTIICFAAALMSLSACKKSFLDKEPLDKYSTTTLWKSSADALAVLNGCYNNWEDGYNVMYLDCASDNAYGQFVWEGFTSIGNGFLSATDTDANNRWKYVNIQRCNWFLANVDPTPMDETLKRRIKAEARFLRAYQYFILTQLYGDVPLVTTMISIDEANKIARTPKADITKFILEELKTIAPDLPTNYSGSDVGRITRAAVLTLKARIELFNKDYATAIADYQTIMNFGYQLFPSYQDLFRIQNENNTEVILDVQYKENDLPNGNLGVMPSSSMGGYSSIAPTQALVDAYEMINGKTTSDPASGYDANNPYVNRDPRLAATVIFPGQLYDGSYFNSIDKNASDYYLGENNSKTGYIVKKYTSNLSDFQDIWNNGLNMIVMRYAEVLLSYAEAKIESNQIDATVYDAVNKVRHRAGMPDVDQAVYNTQTTLRALIRRERRVEFAMEGLRWFDIQRWEIGPQVRSGDVFGARLGTVDENTGALTLTTDRIFVEKRNFDPAKHYLWPVPQKERDINKNLTQNKGY